MFGFRFLNNLIAIWPIKVRKDMAERGNKRKVLKLSGPGQNT